MLPKNAMCMRKALKIIADFAKAAVTASSDAFRSPLSTTWSLQPRDF
jgi:hypothetical protein